LVGGREERVANIGCFTQRKSGFIHHFNELSAIHLKDFQNKKYNLSAFVP